MNNVPYSALPGLEDVYLEDSYVLEITESENTINFKLDVVLTENHPLYQPPKPGEQYCYHLAILKFPSVINVNWVEKHFRKFIDANGETDLGNIDVFYFSDEKYHLEGDWGIVDIISDLPVLCFDEDKIPD